MIKKINNSFLAVILGLTLVLAVPAMAWAYFPDAGPAPAQFAPPSTTSPQSSGSTQSAAATSPNAQDDIQCGINEATGASCSGGSPSADTLSSTIKKILNVLSAIAGVLAVIMIMVAGVRLVTSAGSEESVKKAKGSIVYAVIGIVIVALAQVIVHFVISNAT